VLACDMRFASRENTLLGHPEVGVGLHPGGGGTERLPPLVGRGRALEIVLGANDFDGDTAAQYGFVNRALPDNQLDAFVDALARRIATFDVRAIAAAKRLINQVSLPSTDNLLSALNSFQTALNGPRRFRESKLCIGSVSSRTEISNANGPQCSTHSLRNTRCDATEQSSADSRSKADSYAVRVYGGECHESTNIRWV